jgi:hypothetical protein
MTQSRSRAAEFAVTYNIAPSAPNPVVSIKPGFQIPKIGYIRESYHGADYENREKSMNYLVAASLMIVGTLLTAQIAFSDATTAQEKQAKKPQTFEQCVARGMSGKGSGQTSSASRATAEAWCRSHNNGNS